MMMGGFKHPSMAADMLGAGPGAAGMQGQAALGANMGFGGAASFGLVRVLESQNDGGARQGQRKRSDRGKKWRHGGRFGGTQGEREEKNRVSARARAREKGRALARERECVCARERGCMGALRVLASVGLCLCVNMCTESEMYTLIAANTLDAANTQGYKACSASPCQ